MSRVDAGTTSDDYVFIDLDDPTPWWISVVGVVAIVLIVAVLVAPWAIDISDESPDIVANSALQSTTSVCRPDASGIPGIFDPTVASWSRFCDWFIAPGVDNPDAP